jgi:flagellar basal body rod protein FlgG
MTTILAAAASGMVYHQGWMDAIGHNLANVNSTAFKLTRSISEGVPDATYNETAPRMGVQKSTLDPIFRLGSPQRSDNPLHFSITDDTFFRVQEFDGSTVFTRVGSLAADSDGNIVGFRGRFLTPPINVPPDAAALAIDQFGNISGAGPTEGERVEYGQVSLVRFTNPQGLDDLGDGLYRESVNSGPFEEGTPGSPGFGVLLTGAVEGSNVDMAEEFTSMIIAQRAYTASAKTFSIGDEMLAMATNLTR